MSDAILAAIEQAKAALDQIEMEMAAQKPEEEAPPAPEEGGMPGGMGGMGGMMGKKPMMEE